MKEYKRFTDPLTLKGDKMKTTKLLFDLHILRHSSAGGVGASGK
jgi:hypothetical protein